MNSGKSFLICGGDMRQAKLADSLAACGYKVTAFGFDEAENFGVNVKLKEFSADIVNASDVLVLPLPASMDDEYLSTPMQKETVSLAQLFSVARQNQTVVGGKISRKVSDLSAHYNIVIHDYLKREEMAVLNAIPTVEGAIGIAMENIPVTIHGSRVLVLGFGRIGKLLCDRFHGLGAFVTAEARRFDDLAWIRAYGYGSVPLSQLAEKISDYDIIINTVPSLILTAELLGKVRKESLIIDLASKPGGVDMESAARLGKRVIWALSLPGTVAPVTAGVIIKDTILNILDELEATSFGNIGK